MVIKRDIKRGYTLIELIITITLTTIIFSVVAIFLAKPIQIYAAVAKRVELVDIADLALRRMERDIHKALPNSIRIKTLGNKQVIEMVNAVTGMRYRTMRPGTDDDILNFNTADTEFNVYGPFPDTLLGNHNYRLVIYNIGTNGASSDIPVAGINVYAANTSPGPNPPIGTHVITPATTTVTLSNIDAAGHIELDSGFQFAFNSPQQRLYIIDSPISYVCDPASATITRFHGYAINTVQPIDPNVTPLNSAQSDLLARRVTACSFKYEPGTSKRGGIVTIALTVANGVEQIRLLQQVHIGNAP